ncbi:hypothetical protein CASbig_70 [Mycobacterium phage CASbig]|uniref:hypothetical protein n=1 Tax=Mycobacterium phage CASbig TaxID=1327035 RepID=UPI00032B69BC|nr:hypothetical protein JMN56_gp70 [Mycobacterium phage CASbig]AGK88111.1 hypothetical protein CASbig_70 [Mycobacterium phage CASbig]
MSPLSSEEPSAAPAIGSANDLFSSCDVSRVDCSEVWTSPRLDCRAAVPPPRLKATAPGAVPNVSLNASKICLAICLARSRTGSSPFSRPVPRPSISASPAGISSFRSLGRGPLTAAILAAMPDANESTDSRPALIPDSSPSIRALPAATRAEPKLPAAAAILPGRAWISARTREAPSTAAETIWLNASRTALTATENALEMTEPTELNALPTAESTCRAPAETPATIWLQTAETLVVIEFQTFDSVDGSVAIVAATDDIAVAAEVCTEDHTSDAFILTPSQPIWSLANMSRQPASSEVKGANRSSVRADPSKFGSRPLNRSPIPLRVFDRLTIDWRESPIDFSPSLKSSMFFGSLKKSRPLSRIPPTPSSSVLREAPRPSNALSSVPSSLSLLIQFRNDSPVWLNQSATFGSFEVNFSARVSSPSVNDPMPGAAREIAAPMFEIIPSILAIPASEVMVSVNDLAKSAIPCVTFGRFAASIGNAFPSWSKTGPNCCSTAADIDALRASNGSCSRSAAFFRPSMPRASAPIGTATAEINPGRVSSAEVSSPISGAARTVIPAKIAA